jgi:hypothetical protein
VAGTVPAPVITRAENAVITFLATSTGATTAWQSWNTELYYSSPTSTGTVSFWQEWNTFYEETAGERQGRDAVASTFQRVREEAEEAAALRMREMQASRDRATALLLELLTPEQARSYSHEGYFEVRGSAGGRWRINSSGQAGNVDLVHEADGRRLASFCCHPPGRLPAADAHLAQMLHLVTDEEGFRRTANMMSR